MYETQISRGMDLLDGEKPDWIDDVDENKLRMTSCFACVLGQLYKHFNRGLFHLGIREPSYYGFTIPYESASPGTEELYFQRLTEEWQAAIRNRRGIERLMSDIEMNQYEQVLN